MKNYLSLIILLLFAIHANGHVTLISPKGAEILTVGELIKIEREETISHETQNWDLLFSSNGGQTWDTLKADIDKVAASYPWTIPNIVTTKAKIQIIQDNPNSDYSGISNEFAIEGNGFTQNKLFIPDTLSGTSIDLSFQQGQISFYDGFTTNTYGYNQDYFRPYISIE